MIIDTDVKNVKLEAALNYANLGWPVFPLHFPKNDGKCSCGNLKCSHIGKHPRTAKGFKDATTDSDKIRQWWTGCPKANIGIATGTASHLSVLDIDPRHGGNESLSTLIQENGALPNTWTVTTGSNGRHYYFLYPGEMITNKGNLLPGVDFKTTGGYIVAPPSQHVSGGKYEWLEKDGSIAEIPTWLYNLLASSKKSHTASEDSDGECIPEGERNDTLFLKGCSFRDTGSSKEEIFTCLKAINTLRCTPPLDEGEIARIVDSIMTYHSGASKGKTFNKTDRGNAERLVYRYGEDFRYIPPFNKFLVWDGSRYIMDNTGHLERLAKSTIRAMLEEAAKMENDNERSQLTKFVLASENQNRIKAMIESAKTEKGVAVMPDSLDVDDWLLNCINGTIDLHNGELKPHNKEDLITKIVPYNYDPEASCPTWLAFLDKIMAKNTALINFLQKAIGYALTGLTKEQCLFILHGSGANGKSTFINTIEMLLADYAQQTPTETLMQKKNDSIRNDVARLKGARFVSAAESEQNRAMAEPLIKQMTGGDRLTARFLHGEFFEFLPKFKIFLATNHKPNIRGTDNGIWRRIRLIPFNVTIPAEEQDKDLINKLKAEMPGILRWAVEGCLHWQIEGLKAPPEVTNAVEEYRQEMDPIQSFIDECIECNPCFKVGASEIYNRFTEWCDDTNEFKTNQRQFGKKLREKGFCSSRSGSSGTYVWAGLRVLPTGFSPELETTIPATEPLNLTEANDGNLLM